MSTVSIVLNEAPLSRNFAKATREEIRRTARQLGYYPDDHARSLRRRQSHTVAVLAFDLSDPFCQPIVQGIQTGLQPASYLPFLMDAQTRRTLFDDSLKMILERRVEGVIVIACGVFEENNLLADIVKNKVSVAIVGRDLTRRKFSSVLVDNEAGGALAVRHLIDLGHRRIAVIRGPDEQLDSAPRWNGIRQTAHDAGIEIDPRLVFQLPNLKDSASGFEGGVKFAKQMLQAGRPFTAALAFDDLTALGVVRGLTEAGLRIPEDCSVIGFDDVPPAIVATPGMTTVHQPLKEMGLLAAQWSVQAIEARDQGHRMPVHLHRAVPELVVRQSTAPLTLSSRHLGVK